MFDRFVFAAFGLTAVGLASPAIAHSVQITADVAGTWHIEPDHRPKAGEPAQVWVALTLVGGEVLPLSEANCEMLGYRLPRQPNDPPLLKPTLRAIDAESYQGIPGAEVTFPQTGLYELELSCQPKTAGDFQPFQMQYQATVAEVSDRLSDRPSDSAVASRTAAAAPASAAATETADRANWRNVLPWLLVGCLIALAILFRQQKRMN